MIYLDQGSSAYPKAPGVGQAMKTFIEEIGVNIGRGNYREAYSVEADVLDTRIRLASLFGLSDPRRVIFTPGATFSLNLLLAGLLKAGDHVVISGLEHNAVMRPLSRLADRGGISYSIAPPDPQGRVTARAFEEAIREETRLVLCLHASNVCGSILPLADIGQVCRDRGILFAVDAAQTAGTLPIDMGALGIDFLAFTGHKGLGGPQGIGGFLLTRDLADQLEPLIVGGTGSRSDSFDQPDFLPDKYESGTINIPGILGLRAALIYLEEQGIGYLHAKKMALANRFLEGLASLNGVSLVGPPLADDRLAVVSLDFPGRDNALIAHRLEKDWGILTRVGLHCAPLAHRSLGTFPEGTVRFAFGANNREEEVDLALQALSDLTSTPA